jgi:hypothetical protein
MPGKNRVRSFVRDDVSGKNPEPEMVRLFLEMPRIACVTGLAKRLRQRALYHKSYALAHP